MSLPDYGVKWPPDARVAFRLEDHGRTVLFVDHDNCQAARIPTKQLMQFLSGLVTDHATQRGDVEWGDVE